MRTLTAFIILLGCAPAKDSPPSDRAVAERAPERVYDWCDVYPCEVCSSTGCPPGGAEVSYCCDLSSKYPCPAENEVPDGTTCPDGLDKVVCNWGQTNETGSFTCYDE